MSMELKTPVSVTEYLVKRAEQAMAQLPPEKRSTVEAFRDEVLVTRFEGDERDESFFTLALASLKKGNPVSAIYRAMYEKAEVKTWYKKAAMKARFKLFVEQELAQDKQLAEAFPRELIDKLFEAPLRKRRDQKTDGVLENGRGADGAQQKGRGTRRKAVVTTVENGELKPLQSPGRDRTAGVELTEEERGERQQGLDLRLGDMARNAATAPVTAKEGLLKTEDGVFVIPIEGCRVDLTGERIAMTSFGVEKKILDEVAAAEKRQKVNDLVEQFAAELKTRGYEVDMRACGALARLRSAFEYGVDIGFEGFLALSKKPQFRDVYRDTMGLEHWAVVEQALKRLGLAGE